MKKIFILTFLITSLFSTRSQTYYTSTVQIINPPPCTLCCNGSISVTVNSPNCAGGPISIGLMSPSTGTIVQWNAPMINLCNGIYTVVVNDFSGPPCNMWLVCTPFYPITTDIKEKKDEVFNKILLFPNPVNDLLSVDLNTDNNFEKLQVVNNIGELIIEKYIDLNDKTLLIPTNDLPEGLYLLKLVVPNQKDSYKRFIIKK